MIYSVPEFMAITRLNMTHIITVPAFSDNYIWLICDNNKQYAAIVDPGEADPVIAVLEKQKIQAVAILITHFHYDHGNGISGLLDKYPGIPVYGPQSEFELLNEDFYSPHYGPASKYFNLLTHPLIGGEKIKLDKVAVNLEVMNIPGHTSGHIAYYGDQKLFCGDTLFAGGCGRVFNGTLNKLHNSLQKIAKLPEETQIYCAHEYTLDNIGFAKWVEPDNIAVQKREQDAMALIDADLATVPSPLSLELQTNPFLRTHLPSVKARVETKTNKKLVNASEVFAAMRTWKDTEYD